MSTYTEAEHYISDIPKFAGKHTVEDTGRLLYQIVGDELKSKIIHVAGTNGKGSVCAYLRSVLMKAGCRVGMFTSPHLETMRERICLGEEMISEGDFIAAFEKVIDAVKKEEMTERISGKRKESEDNMHPSFFEFLFLMAMSYFKEKKPDYIILETGLGGRLDATNSILKPEVCVITEIGYDHMQYLGDTMPQIAAEKAGIIKPEVPVVFMNKRTEITEVLRNQAQKTKSQSIVVEKDHIMNVNINNKSIDFSLYTGYYKYVGLSLSTTALYQMENAALAVSAAELLGRKDERITEEAIREGLKTAHWPGRMEEIHPGIYLDGAHNEDGIEAFLSTVRVNPCQGRRLLLFGVVADKRYENMIKQIAESGLFAEVAVTGLESDRSVSIEKLEKTWRQYNQIHCSFYQDAEEAYDYLVSDRKDTDIIYIAGSLYLIGQIRARVRRRPDD